MNPVAFKLFGLEVRWYGILISVGVIIGTILALRESKRISIEEDTLIDLLLYAIPISLLGARAYYVIFSWDYYKNDLIQIFNFRGGGLAIHGAIGQAIGRWGNYINQEAYGRPTNLPWGIIIDGVKVHPTFLYESIGDFLVFLFLLWYRKNKSKVPGEVFLLYLILYSAIRFFIEGLRTDSLMMGSIRVAQLVSIIGIVAASFYFIKRRKEKLK